MKELMKNDNYMAIGVGVLSFVVLAMYFKRRNAPKSSFTGTQFEPSSNMSGKNYWDITSAFEGSVFEPYVNNN